MFERPEEKLRSFVAILFALGVTASIIFLIYALTTGVGLLIFSAFCILIIGNLLSYISSLAIIALLDHFETTKKIAKVLMKKQERENANPVNGILLTGAELHTAYVIKHIDNENVGKRLSDAGIKVGAKLTLIGIDEKYHTEIDGMKVNLTEDAAKHIFLLKDNSEQ